MNNILYIVAIICAVWVIYDVWTKQKMSGGSKIIWTIFALLFSIITAIIYYFMKKK
ncbi:PLDc N-terminal domain-containing protein [Ekhidna sp. To15]|uniref:PLDc N-terminal domain-containing protein n=1 Tax=Ekhidna sp. To15 TaxID=3395267 RepID=UPI003F51B6E0